MTVSRGEQSRLRLWAIAVACAVSASALAMATAAQASVISVGSVLPEGATSEPFKRVQTLFNTALPESGATLASPVNGAIVRWRVQGAVGGPFFLRVLHPDGKSSYEATATSQGATPAGTGLETFSTNLKVQAGDLIGVDPSHDTDEIGFATVAGARYASIFPTPFDGSVHAPSESFDGKEISLSAEIQPAPEITTVSPAFGPVTGTTLVTISGKNLNGTTAVMFGSTPAASFTVDSDTEITATAPSTARPGKVDVTVTTLAGENPNTRFDDYVYRACVVPAVKNKTLRKAKTLLKRRGCKLGHVKKVEASAKKVGKVLKQAPRPGKVLAPGARVRITLGE
ncbi:MAG TPA: IPT/TIG domain-containing protein [Solirubrobacterales bacterium]|nr:IPT/TIG domain-containing protein [Solirubrobacterales bacterium]